MDRDRLDNLSRRIAAASSRRTVLRALFALPAAGMLGGSSRLSAAKSSRSKRSQKKQGGSGGCTATCRKCDLSRIGPSSDLPDCDLQGMHLAGRDVSGSNLRGACLSGADLSGANLDGSSLRETCLNDVVLDGASLSGADLRGAVITGADFRQADLSGARLSAGQLATADLCDTRLPDGSRSDCGTCSQTCNADETCCRGSCANLETDIKHCTRCGNFCSEAPPNAVVRCDLALDANGNFARGCAYFCDTGWDDCDGEFKNGCEVRVADDPNNCGACGKTCPDGDICCGCQCVAPGAPCPSCPTIRSGKLIRSR